MPLVEGGLWQNVVKKKSRKEMELYSDSLKMINSKNMDYLKIQYLQYVVVDVLCAF